VSVFAPAAVGRRQTRVAEQLLQSVAYTTTRLRTARRLRYDAAVLRNTWPRVGHQQALYEDDECVAAAA
jgi:hypothetical protein